MGAFSHIVNWRILVLYCFCWCLHPLYLAISSKVKIWCIVSFHYLSQLAELQYNSKIKALQTDNGGEFRVFLPYLHSYGIQPRFTCPYTSQQNGVAERKYRHIAEMGLTLLSHAAMPLKFWVEGFQTAVYLINLLPSAPLKFRTPFWDVIS